MREIVPGIFHWTEVHPDIHHPVSSYWLEDCGVLIDPLIPAEQGIEWFADRSAAPTAILLSNRHHYRHSGELAERFELPVYCVRAGIHEFTGGRRVTAFDPGDDLPGAVVAIEVGGLCPDESALYVQDKRSIVFADGVIRPSNGGELGFVPDSLMDDPPGTKRALLEAYSRVLADYDFDHVLLAHGQPLIGDGRSRLQAFVDSGGGTVSEL
jgi:hypothetical protein